MAQQEAGFPSTAGAVPPQPGINPASVGSPPLPYGTYQNQGIPITPTEKNGLALTSLILGCVGFCVPLLGGIGAIVTGILGLTKTRDPRVGGRGMSIVGITLGGVSILVTPVLLLLISILLPALTRAREQANRVKCASNMKQIGLAIAMYSNSNGGQFPTDLKKLYESADLSSAVFTCPSSNDTPAAGPTTQATAANLLKPGHASYVYVGDGLTDRTATPDTVVLYEVPSNHRKEGMNVLFGDFHVEWEGRAEAQSILSQQKSGKKTIQIPASP
jgi:prepilin-type processing-associated H-X9-DG protein